MQGLFLTGASVVVGTGLAGSTMASLRGGAVVLVALCAAVARLPAVAAQPDGCTMIGYHLQSCRDAQGPELDLSYMSIESIDATAFVGLSGLATLRLNKNHLTELREGVLDPLTALTLLDLSDNSLGEVARGTFDRLVLLRSL